MTCFCWCRIYIECRPTHFLHYKEALCRKFMRELLETAILLIGEFIDEHGDDEDRKLHAAYEYLVATYDFMDSIEYDIQDCGHEW